MKKMRITINLNWTVKELSRVIFLCKKGLGKEASREDTKLLFKLEIAADEVKAEADEFKTLLETE